MITVDMRDRKPIYEQLIDNIRSLAVQGHLKPDTHLPSVRQLAAELAINPNTIQKAYAELERQNVIYALPGRGNFISPDIGSIAQEEKQRQLDQVTNHLMLAKNAGVSKTEILEQVEMVFPASSKERTPQ